MLGPRGFGRQLNISGTILSDIGSDKSNVGKIPESGSAGISDVFESPGLLHDIIVCWIDQHEAQGGGTKHVQFLLMELAMSRIFYPPAYVRQLIVIGYVRQRIVSGYTDADGPLRDKRRRNHQVLKQLPAPFMCDILEESQTVNELLIHDIVHVYSNERRLVLHVLLRDQSRKSSNMSPERKFHTESTKKGKPHSSENIIIRGSKSGVVDLKAAISLLFQFPQSTSVDAVTNESRTTLQKLVGPNSNNVYKVDQNEEILGCEECRRAKRRKLSDERGSSMQVESPSFSDEEDSWWVRKVNNMVDTFNVEPPSKQMKQTSRSRQKGVLKMQSLAQLASARIEGSQGASTSHMCDSKVGCPHHKSGLEGETVKMGELTKTIQGGDIVSHGNVLKGLSFIEKRKITAFLINSETIC